ncbi:hypothetical protein FQA39_LY15877 [Lamprigera yunnana]|nr:hypothetical protein FQA39_LY15877 [Lamprigera yunnana]
MLITGITSGRASLKSVVGIMAENSIDELKETEPQEDSGSSESGIGGIVQDEQNDRDFAFLKPDKENKQKKRKKMIYALIYQQP